FSIARPGDKLPVHFRRRPIAGGSMRTSAPMPSPLSQPRSSLWMLLLSGLLLAALAPGSMDCDRGSATSSTQAAVNPPPPPSAPQPTMDVFHAIKADNVEEIKANLAHGSTVTFVVGPALEKEMAPPGFDKPPLSGQGVL